MKKIVVLGASGGMGYHLVMELLKKSDCEIIAYARNEGKLKRLFAKYKRVKIRTGNALNKTSILSVCEGADTIFHSINIPYPQWKGSLPRIMENILDGAREAHANLVVVDNIYAYGRSNGEKVTESTEKNPHTKKGKIRLELNKMVEKSGIPYIIAHFPDFYGPNGEDTLLHYTFKKVAQNQSTRFIGKLHVKREYIYLPDGAKALVELTFRNDTYNEHWNIPGPGVISGHEIVQILKNGLGYDKKVGTVTKTMLAFLGIFNPMMREMVEMMYLTEQPVVLSGEKFASRIGPLPKTPYEQGMIETINFLKNQEISLNDFKTSR